MRNRTKLFVAALVAGSALAAAIPASAQNYPQRERGYDQNNQRWDQNDRRWNNNGNANAIRQQIEQLRFRVSRSDNRDRISEREAAGLRRAVDQLQMQFRDYNRNGLTQRETRYLQDRISQIRSRLQYERNDRDGRRY
jgi:Spy/CpxP family protein refolding chaperone